MESDNTCPLCGAYIIEVCTGYDRDRKLIKEIKVCPQCDYVTSNI